MSAIVERTVSVSREDTPGTWLIALTGEHAWPEAALLEQATSYVWSRATHVIIDLSDTTFLDSSVINWLLRAQSTGANACALSIVEGPPSSFAGRVFTKMGLREIFATYPTRQEVSADPRVAAEPQVAEPRVGAQTPGNSPSTPVRSGAAWIEQATEFLRGRPSRR